MGESGLGDWTDVPECQYRLLAFIACHSALAATDQCWDPEPRLNQEFGEVLLIVVRHGTGGMAQNL
jgi:hypothetical protein